MPDVEHLKQDLGYVRGLVGKTEADATPPGVYLLWALLIPVGFALTDLAPNRVGLYWLLAAPAGFLLSTYLGARASRQRGQVEHREGTRHVLHWAGMIGALALTVPLSATGALSANGTAQVMLLLLALSFFLAGVHLSPPLLWVGLLMAAGYLLTFFVTGHVWTTVGLVVSLALLLSALLARRRERAQATPA